MEDYKPNSHKSREKQQENAEKKKVEKVVTGSARTKKKSGLTKVKDVFISEDASNVKSYVLSDVLVPAVKKLISDIVKDGIEMVLYGGTGHGRRRSDGSRADYISYNKYSDRRDDRRYSSDIRARTGYSYEDVVLDSRGEAEEVLMRMDELIDTYGLVSVADLYDLVGLSHQYTDNKYGWTSLRTAEAVRDRDGYVLRLPKAKPLD